MAFHLLGSWQVTSAYHVVADLLGSDSEKVEWLLGDAVTTTSHGSCSICSMVTWRL